MLTTKLDRRTFLLAPVLAGSWPLLSRGAGTSPLLTADGGGVKANEEDGKVRITGAQYMLEWSPKDDRFTLRDKKGKNDNFRQHAARRCYCSSSRRPRALLFIRKDCKLSGRKQWVDGYLRRRERRRARYGKMARRSGWTMARAVRLRNHTPRTHCDLALLCDMQGGETRALA